MLVDGIWSHGQADWWRQAGADLAIGDLYGMPVEPGDFAVRFIS